MKLYLIFKRSFTKYTELLNTTWAILQEREWKQTCLNTRPCSHSAANSPKNFNERNHILPYKWGPSPQKAEPTHSWKIIWNDDWEKKKNINSHRIKITFFYMDWGWYLCENILILTIKKGHHVQLIFPGRVQEADGFISPLIIWLIG